MSQVSILGQREVGQDVRSANGILLHSSRRTVTRKYHQDITRATGSR